MVSGLGKFSTGNLKSASFIILSSLEAIRKHSLGMIGMLNAGSEEVVFSSPRRSNLFENGKLKRSNSINYLCDGRVFLNGHPQVHISPTTMWGEIIKRSTSTAKIDEALKEGEEEEMAEGEHPSVITEEEEITQASAKNKPSKQHHFHLWHHHHNREHPMKVSATGRCYFHKRRSGSV